MYKNYIFDLYGTLVDINTDEDSDMLWTKLALFYSFKGAKYDATEIKSNYLEKVKKMQLSLRHTDYPDFPLEDIFASLYTDKNVNPSSDLVVDTAQLFRVLSIDYVKLYPGVKELLDLLKKKNKKIYLLSNAQRIFTFFEMKLLGIDQYFDDIFFSADHKACKPDTNFYNALINKHNLKPSESIMIGNDYIADIHGSSSVGLSSLYMHSNLSPEIVGDLPSTYTLMECDVTKIADMILK